MNIKTHLPAMLLACATLFASGLAAQTDDAREDTGQLNPETVRAINDMVRRFEKLRVFGLVRFRPEAKTNFNFDKRDLSCGATFCTADDDAVEFVGQKVQIGIENQFSDSVTARIVIQDSRVWGGETGSDTGLNTANNNTNQSTDIREGWVEIKNLFGPVGLQAGRQIFAYGDQRLVGHLDWTNVGRSFDGLRLKYDADWLSSHAWGTVLAEEDSDIAGNATSVGRANSDLDDAYFTGFYNTLKFSEHLHLDAYYLGRYRKWVQRSSPITNPTVSFQNGFVPIIETEDRSRQRDNLHTVGGRLTNRTLNKGKQAAIPFDWSFEYAAQFGETGNRIAPAWDIAQTIAPLPAPLFDSTFNPCEIFATGTAPGGGTQQGCRAYTEKQSYASFAYAATAGFTFLERYRLGAEYAVASGDPDRSDGSVATFENLFHTNHLHYGMADQVSWQNMKGASINFSIDLGDAGKIKLAYWEVDKHKLQDGWYGVAGGGAAGARKTTTESANNARFGSLYNTDGSLQSLGVGYLRKHLFKEYDLSYSVKAYGLSWSAGFSLIHAGDAVRAAKDDTGVKREIYGPQILADLADGRIDNPVTVLLFEQPSFDPAAQFAYIMLSYRF